MDSLIDQYLNFKFGSAVCSVPYYNNKAAQARAAFRAKIGKGSPKDILEEVQTISVRNHISSDTLSNEALKKLLVDNNIGIDCSAFAYYLLDAESKARGKGPLDKHIHFVNCTGIIAKLRSALRPAENCDVVTLADYKNSKKIELADVAAGDFISMQDDTTESERDHILVIYEAARSNYIKINYCHAAAYPEDGIYGTGVKRGTIEVDSNSRSIVSGRWSEPQMFSRAQKSKNEIRRLNWF